MYISLKPSHINISLGIKRSSFLWYVKQVVGLGENILLYAMFFISWKQSGYSDFGCKSLINWMSSVRSNNIRRYTHHYDTYIICYMDCHKYHFQGKAYHEAVELGSSFQRKHYFPVLSIYGPLLKKKKRHGDWYHFDILLQVLKSLNPALIMQAKQAQLQITVSFISLKKSSEQFRSLKGLSESIKRLSTRK